jgi:hypothetical protein
VSEIGNLGNELRVRRLGNRPCWHGVTNDAAGFRERAELTFPATGDPAFRLKLGGCPCYGDLCGAPLGSPEDRGIEANSEFDYVVEKARVGVANERYFRPVRRQFADKTELHLCLISCD